MREISRMKKFRFLLLDAGPIIKLFEAGLWDDFIGKCDVTVCRTVADEAKWASRETEDTVIDLDPFYADGRIRIQDVELAAIKTFHDKFDRLYKAELHDGEKETLAFLCSCSENWHVCAADKAVFRTLGFLGKGQQGISLEKLLAEIGLGRRVEWKFTETFCQKYTALGQVDSVQSRRP